MKVMLWNFSWNSSMFCQPVTFGYVLPARVRSFWTTA